MARPRFINPAFMLSPELPLTPLTSLNYCTSAKGAFDDTTAEQMHEAIMEYRKAYSTKSLALFFHGGLVSKVSGMNNAQQLLKPYSAPPTGDASANTGNAYPYFFVWESGLLETLQHNLPAILAEAIFQRLRDIIGSKAQSVLGVPEVAEQIIARRAPTLLADVPSGTSQTLTVEDISEVVHAVEDDPIINTEKRRIALSAGSPTKALLDALGTTPHQVITSPATLLSPQIVSAIAAEEAHKDAAIRQITSSFVSPLGVGTLALGAGHVLTRIIQRYASGRNHNFHNTVVEEIFRQYYIANVGWAVWNEMKQETAMAFGGDRTHNVGTAMICELIDFYDADPAHRSARVTLLGHSTGAVYICNFLMAMHTALQNKTYANDIRVDVILMAPAVRVDVLAGTLSQYGDLVRNLRVFQMSDQLESQEILLQVNGAGTAVNTLLAQVYTSSLLYFIAGVLEDPDDDTPIDGMQRYFLDAGAFQPHRFPDIDAVAAFYQRQNHATIASDTSKMSNEPGIGQRCTSHHHGGFPTDSGTLQSVCYLLQTGVFA